MRNLILLICLGVAHAAPTGAQGLRAEAERALERSFAHQLREEFGLSRRQAEKALAGFEHLGDPVAQAVALEFVAVSELAEGRLEKGLEAFTEAFARASRGGDDFAIAALGCTAGRLAREVERGAEAEGFFNQGLEALERLRRGDRWVGWFESHHADLGLRFWGEPRTNSRHRLEEPELDVALAILLRHRGALRLWLTKETTAGKLDLERAAQLLPRDHDDWGLLLVDLGGLRVLENRPDEAYPMFDEARGLLESRCCPLEIFSGLHVALFFLADIADRRGSFSESLDWNQSGLEWAKLANDFRAEVELLTQRSWILSHAGRQDESRRILEEARRLAEVKGVPKAADTVDRSAAFRELAAGRLQAAAELASRSAGSVETSLSCEEKTSGLVLALAYRVAGLQDKSQEAWNRLQGSPRDPKCLEVDQFPWLPGVQIFDQIGAVATWLESPSRRAFINPEQLELIQWLVRLPRSDDPRLILSAELDPMLQRAKARGDHEVEHTIRLMRALLLFELGDLEAASFEVETVILSARQANDRNTQRHAAWLSSRIARQQGRTDEAIRHLEEALTLEEALLAGNTLDEFLLAGAGGAALQYETLVELLLDSGRNEEAFAVAERSRSQALVRLLAGGPSSAPTSRGDLDARREVERLRVERRALADRQARGGMEAQSFAAESARLNARYDEATLRLKLTRHREAPGPAPAAPTVTDVRRSLPAETTLVSFFVLAKETIVWVLDAERLTTQRLALGRDELAALVTGFRERIATRRPLPRRGAEAIRSPEAPSAAGDELSARLWAPLVPLVRHRRVILEPHDALHALPFAALRGPNGRFLVEDFVPSTLPSAATLRFLRVPRPPASGEPLVVGDPALPPGWKLPRLAGAHAEATRLGQRLGTTPLVGTGATETAVRARASAAGLIHIAAHFVRLEGEPRYSHLALGPDAENDGKLEVHEIFDELELPTTRLVVLSACETALGRRTDGDEIEGAVRGLLDAGSAAVLATHWAIDDEVSTTLMDRFYERLLAGEPAAEALRKAQLETLAEHEAPHFWAAFTLAGDPGVSLAEP